MTGLRRHLVPTVAAVVVSLLFLNGVSGTLLFARAKVDPLAPADAILVLSGEHDGREAYGLELARQGYAKTVVISKPNKPDDEVFKRVCQPRNEIRVICESPVPFTTRGEAMMARELADQNGWHSIIVVSWRYHLPRARKIFEQCFTSSSRTVIMREVPRQYRLSVAEWQYNYLYQYGAWIKAEILGCERPTAS